MTKSQSKLETTRHDAQELHKKISTQLVMAEQATWADVKAVQADIIALGAKMRVLAGDQADDVRAVIDAAVAKLTSAGQLVEDKALATKDVVKQANVAMLASAHHATQSLSAAIATVRTSLARAIEPAKGVA